MSDPVIDSSAKIRNPKYPNYYFIMARKSSLLKQTLIFTLCFLLALYAFFNTFLNPANAPPLHDSAADRLPRNAFLASDGSAVEHKVKIYMYDLPTKFTTGIIEHHALARGSPKTETSSPPKYPGHQHMGEWYLFSDLHRSEKHRVGSPVIRVDDPEEADLFYVPVFSSLSLIVNPSRPADSGKGRAYSDKEMQDELADWLERQEYWRRNNGRDHVIIAGDPNALFRILDRVKNAVLLVSDFGRVRPDQGSLVKDVIIPYSHRIRGFDGDIGVENRDTLLFFMGNRYRKDGGKIRDLLFQTLENEEGMVIKHGTQSRESRRAATRGMHTAKFCLNPAGDTPSACRLFDSIVSLCVPVIVSDSIELPFEDVIDYREFAIFVETNDALKPGFLAKMLRKISDEKIIEYQKEMLGVRRYFNYENPNGAVNEIWRQVAQKLPLINLMINRDKRLVKRHLSEPDCSCLCTNQTALITYT